MKLLEIFNKLTEPKDVLHKQSGTNQAFQWTTSKGNKVRLHINTEFGNSLYISFDVNDSDLEKSREIDREIMSSVFYKISEFIKQNEHIEIIEFTPLEDTSDLKGESKLYVKQLSQLIDSYSHLLSDDLVQNKDNALSGLYFTGKIDDDSLESFYSIYTQKLPKDAALKFRQLIDKIKQSNVTIENNRRRNMYLYAVRKYLPDWDYQVLSNGDVYLTKED
jgi:hypothetical protein